jgi:hypothetical protein
MRSLAWIVAMNDESTSRPAAAFSPDPTSADWPVDVQRTDASGEVDMGQLQYNLSLTPLQRIEQNDDWAEFVQIARCAGQRLHGKQHST